MYLNRGRLTSMVLNWKMYFKMIDISQYVMMMYQKMPEGLGNATMPHKKAVREGVRMKE